MRKFIKLSNRIINPSHLVDIRTVVKNDTFRYIIHLNKSNYSGWSFFGAGTLDNDDNNIVICSKTDIEDYRRIQEWILEQELAK